MSRLIDADAIWPLLDETLCKGCENYGGVKCRACLVDDVVGVIEEMPESIVRCKDCIHCDAERSEDGLLWCNAMRTAMMDMEYCSHGERREDGTTN